MSKGTTLRNIRIDDATWTAAKAEAEANDTTVSEVVRVALRDYAAEAVK